MRAKPSSVAASVVASLFLCPSAFSEDGRQLFHRMQEALGGAERIAAIHDFEQRVRADTWDGNGRPLGEVRKRTRWVRPKSLRADQVGPRSTYVLFFDGTSGWVKLPRPER